MDYPAASSIKNIIVESIRNVSYTWNMKYDGTFRKHKLEMSYTISMMKFQSYKVLFVYIFGLFFWKFNFKHEVIRVFVKHWKQQQ